MRENLAFNRSRILIGILILLSCIIFYTFHYDYIFLFIINLLIFLDLKSLILNNKKTFYFIIILYAVFSFIFYNSFIFSNIYLLLISFFITLSFLYKKYLSIIFIIVVLIFSFLLLNLINYERNIFYTIIFISFLNDSLAYLFGNFLKGPLILPSISPKKTWSGTTISFFLSTIVLYYMDYDLIVALLLSISLFLGDIYFSYIKRNLAIKDFSNTLGSHGGILDRLDSMFLITIILTFISYIS